MKMSRESEKLKKKEERFLKNRTEKKEVFLTRKLEEKVPEKLQSALNRAFEKAFALVFEKGTGIIEKTYNKEELENTYRVNEYAASIRQNKKSRKAFSRNAAQSGAKNLMISGAAGISMGVLGIGLPDIPFFTGMMLKSIYEIALHYGFRYDSEGERYFILKLIQGAVSYGTTVQKANHDINEYIATEWLPLNYVREEEIQKAASLLSNELLYTKFLQGIPVIGVAGGIYDAFYMRKITQYANLKYQQRFYRRKEEQANE